jgi:hypothetical protein
MRPRPWLTPPFATNHPAIATASCARSVTGRPKACDRRAAGSAARPPPRSTRMSAGRTGQHRARPVSSAKPNLPGRRGIRASAAVSVAAKSPSCDGAARNGVTIRLRRLFGLDIRVDQALRPQIVDQRRMRGLGHAAQLQVRPGGQVDDPVAMRQRRLAQWHRPAPGSAGRPAGGCARPARHPTAIGRKAPGHQPLTSYAAHASTAAIELRRRQPQPACIAQTAEEVLHRGKRGGVLRGRGNRAPRRGQASPRDKGRRDAAARPAPDARRRPCDRALRRSRPRPGSRGSSCRRPVGVGGAGADDTGDFLGQRAGAGGVGRVASR